MTTSKINKNAMEDDLKKIEDDLKKKGRRPKKMMEDNLKIN